MVELFANRPMGTLLIQNYRIMSELHHRQTDRQTDRERERERVRERDHCN